MPFDQNLTASEKVTEIIRTLPPSFDSLAMASTFKGMKFEEIVAGVCSSIERRKETNPNGN